MPCSAKSSYHRCHIRDRDKLMKGASFRQTSAKLMKQSFRKTSPIYTVTLTILSAFIPIFSICFFVAYFDPNFSAEYREAAPISTVLAFMKGVNPFQEEFVEMYGNLYSVLWPGIIYLLAKIFGLSSYDQIRLLMFVLNAGIVMGTA